MNAAPPALYPPAPWQLRGLSLQTLRLAEVRRARDLVPSDLRVVQIFPGRTIAAVYCARYGRDSTLSYSELAVAPALVQTGRRIGFWISHIYVDDPRSIAGGRAIWNLPKRFASFAWSHDQREVIVSDTARTLCRIAWEPCVPRLRAPVLAPVLVAASAGVRTFWARGSCRLGRCRARIAADPSSPVAQLQLDQSRHVFAAIDLTLDIPPPR